MLQVFAVFSALLFADVAPPASPPPDPKAGAPLEMSAVLVRGELRVGEKATFRVSIRNRSKVDQKLGNFKNGGWTLSAGTRQANWSRNTSPHWYPNCGGPVHVVLKPDQAATSEYEVDLTDEPAPLAGTGTLSFSFVYSYKDGSNCVMQPLAWTGSVEVGHPR